MGEDPEVELALITRLRLRMQERNQLRVWSLSAQRRKDEFLDAKQEYDEERDEERESASTSITVTH